MRALIVASLALLLACGKTETVQPEAAPKEAAAAPAAAPPDMAAEDPEPPDAQAKAEAVVNADFNRNKTTMLKAEMTTLVDKTSSLSGFATALASNEEKIEDKLSRLAAKETDTEIRIALPGAILFDFDSAEIRPDAERTLNDVVSVIGAYKARPVVIEGHTDSIASDEYNQKLSETRARSVTGWLAKHGIESARLKAAGLGETKPVATNDTAEGRQQNRRVEIVIAKR